MQQALPSSLTIHYPMFMLARESRFTPSGHRQLIGIVGYKIGRNLLPVVPLFTTFDQMTAWVETHYRNRPKSQAIRMRTPALLVDALQQIPSHKYQHVVIDLLADGAENRVFKIAHAIQQLSANPYEAN